MLVTTHDLDVIDGVLDQVVFLRDGRVSGIERGAVHRDCGDSTVARVTAEIQR